MTIKCRYFKNRVDGKCPCPEALYHKILTISCSGWTLKPPNCGDYSPYTKEEIEAGESRSEHLFNKIINAAAGIIKAGTKHDGDDKPLQILHYGPISKIEKPKLKLVKKELTEKTRSGGKDEAR